MNCFELLEAALLPLALEEQEHTEPKQLSNYLAEHLRYIQELKSSLIAFEAELQPGDQATLETSVYLGIHWRDERQKKLLEQAIDEVEWMMSHEQRPVVNVAVDPHRLQVSYGQHALSLGAVIKFSREQKNSMDAYLSLQQVWSNGKSSQPVHSSGEAQRLVCSKDALGYNVSLPERIMYQGSSSHNISLPLPEVE
jgi:hypothetical protein